MATLPDKYFDLAIVDPPYGINWTKKIAHSEDQAKKREKLGYKTHKIKNWDSNRPNNDYFIELARVSKHQIIWGANYFTDYLRPSRSWIIWDKVTTFSTTSHEMAWSSFDKKIGIFSRMTNLDRGFMNNDGGGIHPTEKPVKLYEWILTNYAKQGQKILDTHLGSGSSAIAAHYFGVGEFVGCELDEDYFKAACERFDGATKQEAMF